MSFIHRHPGSGGVQPIIGAAAAALVLLAVIALPAGAHEGSTRLSDASVTPRTGTPSTIIEFRVTYRSSADREPDYVRVRIDGTTHRMAGHGTRWEHGVEFSYSTRLDVGTYQIVFEAADGHGGSDRDGGGTVRITAEIRTRAHAGADT